MRNYLIFDGKDCRDFGVYISGQGTFSSPARAYEMQSIPGRNGDLIGSDRRLENLELTYPAFVYSNFRENIRAFRSFLLSRVGYKKLQDTYHPDEFRKACYTGPMEPDVLDDNSAGNFEITFTCKPQRYLLPGENFHKFTSNGSLYNPTLFDAQPLIRVYGSGTLKVGSVTITISSHNYDYIDIDCEMMDAFYGATNCNSLISMTSLDFPVLPPGETGIELSGIQADIKARWWQV